MRRHCAGAMRGRLPFPLTALAACTLAALAALGGCTEHLITTPYVMQTPAARQTFDSLDPALKTPGMEVVYVTDRVPSKGEGTSRVHYGYGRDLRVHYGLATVGVDPELTWEEFRDLSVTGERDRNYELTVERVEQMGTFSGFDQTHEVRDGELVYRADAEAVVERENEEFYKVLRPLLARTDRKEVVVFVHGFNNTLDYALMRLAQAWHFGGRQGVPIVYSWPGGYGGPFGYAYDRESGEFTIPHLKMTLRRLALCPDIERVHIISHSRGTDVATTALRELNAEVRGITGRTPLAILDPAISAAFDQAHPRPSITVSDILKLETLVLAAPDLDVDVFRQRFINENMLDVAKKIVIYFSNEDEALGWARWLFGSSSRLGSLKSDEFKPESRAFVASLPCVEMINCDVSGFTTHAYAFQHPAALSDLILVLRDRKGPGAANGRPLDPDGVGVWKLTNDYLRPQGEPRE